MFSWIIAFGIFLSSISWGAPSNKLHLVSFESPPFTGENLPDGGAAISYFKEMFRKQGYELEVTFAPVLRAKKQAEEKNDIVGYFPATNENLRKNFALSKTVHTSTWGLAERVDRPVTWKSVEDLTQFKIGNVVGYDLAAVLNPAKNKLNIEEVGNDEQNLIKLANGRLDLAFIDFTVYKKLMQTSEPLRPFQKKIQLNPKPIQVYDYGVAFKGCPNGKRWLKVFNSSFKQEEFVAGVEAYLRKHQGALP